MVSATRGGSGLHTAARERTWWLVLVVVALALVLLAWGPWERGSGAGEPPLAGATSDGPAQEPSASVEAVPETLAERSAPSPEPSLTRTSNTRPATPNAPSGQFDERTALGLFLGVEQLAAAIPAASDASAVTPSPAGWGLPAGTTVSPTGCRVAATVVDAAPVGFVGRAWAGQQVRFAQEVLLLPGPADARAAFAALVGTVDTCPEYRLDAADGSATTWDAQPAIEGQGLFPSIVQQVTVDDGTGVVDNGYRGHLLVGNAIVSWTARTTGAPASLGTAESLADVVQERALAAVRSLR